MSIYLIGGLCLVLLIALCGATYWCLALRDRLGSAQREMTDLREQLERRSAALAAAEREVARLRRVPKAEIVPMLQLAHELRSPLAAVQSAMDTLLQGYAQGNHELQGHMLRLARDRAEAMLTRVNDFMRLGAVKHAATERRAGPVQLDEILHGLLPEMQVRAQWRQIELQAKVPSSLAPVWASGEDMEHLLSNLISNAIKYTQPGGRVTVALQESEGETIGTVEDTGIGIPEEDLQHIFDGFYRAKKAREMDANGTGLGLAIVKQIVELYGGHLTVESTVGRGSTFCFALPQMSKEHPGPTIESAGGGQPESHEQHESKRRRES